MENSGEQSKSLLKRLQEKNPDRNVLSTAISDLKDESDLKKFFDQYVEWLKGRVEESPESVALQNIGYAVGYYDQETADRWMKALPGVSHPIFGDNIPFDEPEAAYQAGREASGSDLSSVD